MELTTSWMANVENHFNVFHWQGQNPRIASPDWRSHTQSLFPMQLAAHGRHLLVKTTNSSINHQSPPVNRLVALLGAQSVGKLLQRAPDELSLLPQVGGEETVGVGDGGESSLEGVLEGLGGAGG